jgi:mRNA interferase MazF
VYWVSLDPTVGGEVKKRRPAVILSPDEMNRNLSVVIVAPITSSKKAWPTRLDVELNGKAGQIMLDQIRTVDKSRLAQHIAAVEISEALLVLQNMFKP